MTTFDFNNAEPQRAGSFDLIPEGTIVLVVSSLRPGQAGPGGMLKASNSGECLMADFEFIIDGGQYDRRKVWGQWVTEGQTDGQQKAANITRSRLRAMLESAYGVDPRDESPDAQAKRQVAGWQGFDGLRFCAKIGIEKGGLKNKADGPDSERYADKNVIYPVTPDDDDYVAPGPQNAAAKVATPKVAANGATAPKPAWAS